MNKKTTFTKIAIAALLISFVTGMHVVEVAKANPYWHPPTYPPGQPDPQWIYIQTITGNQSQTVNMFMPTQAHWRVSGTYVSSGLAGITIYFGSQSSGSNSNSSGASNMTWGVGFEHIGKEQVQGNVQIKITAANILSYTLVAEYDNASVNPAFVSGEVWASKASPLTRYGQGVAVVNGKIYAIGGYSIGDVATATVLQYDPTADKWFEKKSMPNALAYFGTTVYENEIYVIGGYSGSESVGTTTSQVWVYNPQTDTWNQNKTSMPTPRMGAQAHMVDGKIYVIGGSNDEGFANANEAYDPTTDTWTAKTPIPVPASHYASAVVDDKIYVIGGTTRNPNGTRVASRLNLIYDTKTDTWKIGSPISNTTVSFASAATTTGTLNPKRIYVISGNLTQIYNPANDHWTTGTPIPATSRIDGFGDVVVANLNDQLYAVGGVYIDTYVYSINTQYTPANDIPLAPSASPTPTAETPASTSSTVASQSPTPSQSPTVPEFTPAVVFAFMTFTYVTALALRRRQFK